MREMNSTLLIAAFAITLLFGAGLAVTSLLDSRRKQMQERIGQTIGAFGFGDVDTGPRLTLEAAPATQFHPWLSFLPGRSRILLEQVPVLTGGKITIPYVMGLGAVAGVAAGAAAMIVSNVGPLFALPVAVVVMLVTPLWFAVYLKRRYDSQFLAVFPDGLDLIVRALKAGLPVTEALATISSEVPDPVGAEFRRIVDELRLAADIDALKRAAERIAIVDFHFFVSALVLQRQTGGNLTEIVSTLSMTIRRRNEIRLKARATSAEARASAWVLGLVPPGVGVVLYFVNPDYMGILVEDPRGHEILGVAGLSLFIGVSVMRALMRWALR